MMASVRLSGGSNGNAGVVRYIKLQQGERYRFVLAYNESPIEQFVTKDFIVQDPPGMLGDSVGNPVEMSVHLGVLQRITELGDVPHINDSAVILDSDDDGYSDYEEIMNIGSDPNDPGDPI